MAEFKYDSTITIQSTEAIIQMPHLNRLKWASHASQLLHKLGGEHTFQPPAEKLDYALSIGHALAATNSVGELTGFIKMSPWVVDSESSQLVNPSSMAETPDDFEDIHTGQKTPVCVEIGSLVVDSSHQGKNIGKALVQYMLDESEKTYPGLLKIAVVTNDNAASLKVFEKLQWEKVSREDAIKLLRTDILEGWEPASTIFIHTYGHN